jgi:predicted NodU family carbamoyl transferase
MRVVGISEGYHDAGYCILDDDEIVYINIWKKIYE